MVLALCSAGMSYAESGTERIVSITKFQSAIEAAKEAVKNPPRDMLELQNQKAQNRMARSYFKSVSQRLTERFPDRPRELVEQLIVNMVCCISGEEDGHAMLTLFYNLDVDPIIRLEASLNLLDSEDELLIHEARDHLLVPSLFSGETGYDFSILRRHLNKRGGELEPELAAYVYALSAFDAFKVIVDEKIHNENEAARLLRAADEVGKIPSYFRSTRSLTDEQEKALGVLVEDNRWWVRLFVPQVLEPASFYIKRDQGKMRTILEELGSDPNPIVRHSARYYLPRDWEPQQ